MSRLTIWLMLCVAALMAVVTGVSTRDTAYASIYFSGMGLLAQFLLGEK